MNLPNFDSCFHRFEKGINKGKLPYVEQIQLDILRYLARYGKSTKTQLIENLGQPVPEISKAVDKLHDKKLAESYCNKCKIIIKTNDLWKKHQVDHEKKKIKTKKRDSNQGKTKRFVRLTISGLKVSIEDPLSIKDKVILDKPIHTKKELKKWEPITSEQFWNYLINELGDSSYENIAEIDRFYQTEVLQIDFDHFIPKIFDKHTKDKRDSDWYYDKKIVYDRNEFDNEIAFFVAESKERMTKSELIKKITAWRQKHNSRLNNIENEIDQDIRYGYLQLLNGKIELTHSGLLEYLFLFYREHFIDHEKSNLESRKHNELSNNPESLAKLGNIRQKYSFLLPDIFNGDNFDKLGISFYDVVELLLMIYKNLDKEKIESNYDEYEDEEIQEHKTLERCLQNRKEAYIIKFITYVDYDIPNNLTQNPNNAVRRLIGLLGFTLNYEPELKEMILDTRENFYQFYNDKITNLIYFEFYSYYKIYKGGWANSQMKNSEIHQNYNREVKTLIEFNKKHLDVINNSL